jgi:hypothetical protein
MVVAVLIASTLVGAVAGVAVHRDRRSHSRVAAATTTTSAPSTSAASSTTSSAPATPAEAAIDALVTKLERFVEDHRGLKFKQPVKVTLLATDAFTKRITDASNPDPGESGKASRILRALHLLPAGVDVGQAQQALLGAAVLGFYDSKTKELVVRGDDGDQPEVREVLVHELTHALQDQWFTLERPELDKKEDDSPLGFQTVYEGDAVRIQTQYHQSLSSADRRRVDEANNAQAGSAEQRAPRALLEQLLFPYQYGPRFTQALVDADGQARLDEAFRAPPTTTEQLLNPDKFLAGEPPKAVAVPAADGTVVQHNVFGQFGFFQILEDSVSPSTAAQAAQGWGGDQFVAWNNGSTTCVRDNVVMDTQRDTDELLSSLKKWAAKYPGVTVTGRSPITITSCA